MRKEQLTIDVSTLPELARVAEEVRHSRIPRVLRRGDEVIAKIVPAIPARATLPAQRTRREKTKEDIEAFLASAGSWSDVDTERFKADLAESRRSSRPPVAL